MNRHNKTGILNQVAAPLAKEEKPFLRLRQVQTSPQIGKTPARGVLNDALDGNKISKADFEVRVKHLARTQRVTWTIKQFRSLGDKLFEIKWKTGDVQWRALGYDDKEGYFVVVQVCTHKMQVYDPPKCIDSALIEKTAAIQGQRKVIEYVL
jgi:hypothetical protein